MKLQKTNTNALKQFGAKTTGLLGLLLTVVALSPSANAQVAVPFTLRQPTFQMRGDFTLIGNSNLAATSGQSNHHAMKYLDVDNDNATFNSTSATLSYDYGSSTNVNADSTTIVYAGLYWGGRIQQDGNKKSYITVNGTNYYTNQVELKGPGASSYTSVTAADNSNILFPDDDYRYMYAGYADVTQYVKDHGVGAYTVANMALNKDDGGSTGYYGGWALVVVYSNPAMQPRTISLNDGYAYVYGGGSNSSVSYNLTIKGLQPPASGTVTPKIGYFAFEGDQEIDGDYLGVKRAASNTFDYLKHDGTTVTSANNNNTSGNFFDASIYNLNNLQRSPSNTNNFGVDLGVFNLTNANGKYLRNTDTSITFKYGTNGDTYVIPFFATSIPVYMTKGYVVNDANANTDGLVNKTGTEALPAVYANVLGSNGNVIASILVANGAFDLGGIGLSNNANYTVQLSATQGTVGSVPPTDTPSGWLYTGESVVGGTPAAGTQGDGRVTFHIDADGNVTGLILGINKIPTSHSSTTPSTPAPLTKTGPGSNYLGGNNWILPPSAFGGTDADGHVKTFVLTAMPANVDTITVDGVKYTSIPAGGIVIPSDTLTHNVPGLPIQVHIKLSASSTTDIQQPFYVIDNGLARSNNSIAYFHSATPLPVKLVSFTGRAADAVNILNWTTAVELNSEGFSVEKSTDARTFEAMGFVNSDGGTFEQTYSYTDNQPSKVTYYRLKQVDLNGAYTYSPVISVVRNGMDSKVVVYPNPASDVLHIQQTGGLINTATLVDMSGRTVRNIQISGSDYTLNLGGLPAGLYILNIGQNQLKVQVR